MEMEKKMEIEMEKLKCKNSIAYFVDNYVRLKTEEGLKKINHRHQKESGSIHSRKSIR